MDMCVHVRVRVCMCVAVRAHARARVRFFWTRTCKGGSAGGRCAWRVVLWREARRARQQRSLGSLCKGGLRNFANSCFYAGAAGATRAQQEPRRQAWRWQNKRC
eukprot:gene20318-biopygen7052